MPVPAGMEYEKADPHLTPLPWLSPWLSAGCHVDGSVYAQIDWDLVDADPHLAPPPWLCINAQSLQGRKPGCHVDGSVYADSV